MRYFFHIVDRYGLSRDQTGCECADHDAAVLHAERIAEELAKAGEFFRSSFVLIGAASPESISSNSQGAAVPSPEAIPPEIGVSISSPALYRETLICGQQSCL